FMAPVGLRLTMKKVRLTDDEARRMLLEQTKGVFDPSKVRVLLPTSGGPNTPAAALVAAGLAARSINPVELMFVRAPRRLGDLLLGSLRGEKAHRPVDDQLPRLRQLLGATQPPAVRTTAARNPSSAIVARAGDGFDLVVIGASQRGHSLGGPVLADVVE